MALRVALALEEAGLPVAVVGRRVEGERLGPAAAGGPQEGERPGPAASGGPQEGARLDPAIGHAARPPVTDVPFLPGAALLRDRVADGGPMAGLDAALSEARRTGRPGVFLAGCDLPLLPPALVRLVVDRFLEQGADRIVVPRGPREGDVEPLAACYPAALATEVRRRLDTGDLALRDLIAACDPTVLSLEEMRAVADPATALLNVNTPDGRAEAPSLPPILCVSGLKDSGKTSLVVALAAELSRRGYRVMTVKHGRHFTLDTPGTDSWRHREEGGAVRTVLAGPDELAVTGAWSPAGEEGVETLVERFLSDADVVLAEGYKRAPLPRVEINRKAAHPRPIYDPARLSSATVLALVTDLDESELPGREPTLPILRPEDPGLAARIADIAERMIARW